MMIITVIIFFIFMVIAYCIVRGGTHREVPEIKEVERKTRLEYESESEKKKTGPEV